MLSLGATVTGGRGIFTAYSRLTLGTLQQLGEYKVVWGGIQDIKA